MQGKDRHSRPLSSQLPALIHKSRPVCRVFEAEIKYLPGCVPSGSGEASRLLWSWRNADPEVWFHADGCQPGCAGSEAPALLAAWPLRLQVRGKELLTWSVKPTRTSPSRGHFITGVKAIHVLVPGLGRRVHGAVLPPTSLRQEPTVWFLNLKTSTRFLTLKYIRVYFNIKPPPLPQVV